MPVADLKEARDVDQLIRRALDADTAQAAVQRLRELFVDKLDFDGAAGQVRIRLDDAELDATRVARREGVQIVAAVLPKSGRVTSAVARKAIEQIRNSLGGDILLLAANRDRSQWNFIFPSYRSGRGDREILRRMTVERGLPFRTVAERVSSIWSDSQRSGDLRGALERAYDVDAVTKEFFREYRRVFERVMGLIEGISSDEDRKLFCQTLFNRLMFLYFLQRKGWLTFKGDTDYLNALWRDAQRQKQPNF